MNRYGAMFAALEARGEGAFGGFLMLGDPDLVTSARLLDALVEGGVDMVEVGLPFSDPVADGPVIQAAAGRAFAAGVRIADCLALIADFRARHPHVPLGILTYANLVLAPGRARFFDAAIAAGADSLLIADLPAFEAEPWVTEMRAAGLEAVLIAAANTPPETLDRIAALGSGYTYCVARAGVTGADVASRFDHRAMLDWLAQAGAAPPVFGFGIGSPEQVRAALGAGARGVISGSALVSLIETSPDPAGAIRARVALLKAATRPADGTTPPTVD